MQAQVYLVDDEASIREAVRQWLELSGHQVRLFARAEDCLAAVTPDFAGVEIGRAHV